MLLGLCDILVQLLVQFVEVYNVVMYSERNEVTMTEDINVATKTWM